MYRLIACPGTGSAIVEALLDLTGFPYEIDDVDLDNKPADRQRLIALNSLGQVPVMKLPDGSLMTESAAIALYLSEQAPAAGLAPPTDDPLRACFLRWLIFFVANIYPMFTVGDDPRRWLSYDEAQKQLRASSDAYREECWRIVESNIAPNPWFLGDRFSALDVYVKVMSHWRPRRNWFEANCPKLNGIAVTTDREPRLAKVWQRNFN